MFMLNYSSNLLLRIRKLSVLKTKSIGILNLIYNCLKILMLMILMNWFVKDFNAELRHQNNILIPSAFVHLILDHLNDIDFK